MFIRSYKIIKLCTYFKIEDENLRRYRNRARTGLNETTRTSDQMHFSANPIAKTNSPQKDIVGRRYLNLSDRPPFSLDTKIDTDEDLPIDELTGKYIRNLKNDESKQKRNNVRKIDKKCSRSKYHQHPVIGFTYYSTNA